MRFFGLFRAKMNTIGIQNPKLIVTNDYQQFLAHFEWFLALFQISDVNPELLLLVATIAVLNFFKDTLEGLSVELDLYFEDGTDDDVNN